MKYLLSTFFAFKKDARAAAAIEFAVILPLLILILLGGIEITRYLMINQKMTTTANNLSSYISQMRLNDGDSTPLDDGLVNAFDSLISPFDPTKGGFRVTAISNNGGAATTEWTQSMGTFVGATQVPNGIGDLTKTLLPTDTLIAVEIYYNYDNIIPGAKFFSSALNFDKNLYQRSVLLARLTPQPIGEFNPNPAQPSGCCGAYCNERPAGVRCTGCYLNADGVPTKGGGMCALNATAKNKYKIPDCSNACENTTKPCTPETKTCRCNKEYCKYNGG